jgi:hypothetical protein
LPRRVVVVVSVLLAAVGLVVAGRGAGASVSPSPRRAAGFDGRVRVAVAAGNTIYLGGQFTRATDVDGRVVTRNRVAAVDAATGALLAWNPNANRAVHAIAVAGATVYLGGEFSSVGGAARSRLAAVSAGGAGAVLAWDHRADGQVRALAASSSRLYAGGQFSSVDGAARSRLAAFSLSGGALDGGWRPSADGPVHALRVGLSGTRVYVAGSFARLGGDPAHGYAGAVHAATGAVDGGFKAAVGFPIRALTSTATSVYGAGDGLGGQLAAWTTTGAAKFPTLQTDGGGQAIAVIGAEVYLGGHFDNVCPSGVRQDAAGRSVCSGPAQPRRKLLGVSAATGRLTTWAPTANSALGVFALAPTAAGSLAAGGDFTQVAGASHRRLAMFG